MVKKSVHYKFFRRKRIESSCEWENDFPLEEAMKSDIQGQQSQSDLEKQVAEIQKQVDYLTTQMKKNNS